MDIFQEVAKRCKGYGDRSQESVRDPLVLAKLFDIAGSASWYVTEYDPENHIAFGYVE
ncbi:MAG: DUF2958 domain-containing protein [Gammaproteobacteria bacterium]|nr:DUF2958 domain-containing protein [Gammaproteobacteria bacterium]